MVVFPFRIRSVAAVRAELEHFRGDAAAGALELLVEREGFAHEGVILALGKGTELVLVMVDQAQKLHESLQVIGFPRTPSPAGSPPGRKRSHRARACRW